MENFEQPELFYEIFDSSLPRLGPGADAHTARALDVARRDAAERGDDWSSRTLEVLDVGCGVGMQTLALARELDARIVAIDNHPPFLTELDHRAASAGVAKKIEARCLDMAKLGAADGPVDLVWSEGAAYCMAFDTALVAWRDLLQPGGYLAATELCWLTEDPPAECREFFAGEYPAMTDIDSLIATAEASGYAVVEHFVLPDSAWWDHYYAPLDRRVADLAVQYADDPEKLALIQGVQREIEIFHRYAEHYGYVFLVLRRCDLARLGFDRRQAFALEAQGRPELSAMRVVSGGGGSFGLVGERAMNGRIAGRLRHVAHPADLPVVGDWVAVAETDDVATIQHVLPRRTELMRRAAGTESGTQIVAVNVDTFFVVTAPDSFNLRRLERYLAAVWGCGATPVVVLNKTDLCDDRDELINAIGAVAPGVPVVGVSALTGDGAAEMERHLRRGQTFGFIGPSGVGKSTLVNRLLGQAQQNTGAVRRDGKGRHTTTAREIVELPGGAFLLDTPGMREFGLIDEDAGIDASFADIVTQAKACRFRDCRHEDEPGCAVTEAVADGRLDADRLASYHKLQKEVAVAQLRRDPQHAGRPKKRWKEISKVIRKMPGKGGRRS